MKQKTFYSLLIGVLVFAASCYKDKGNYDYDTFNKVVIDLGNNGFLSPRSSDNLSIQPVLFYQGDSIPATAATSEFSFTWYCNNQEIAQTANLEYPVKDLTGKRPYVKLMVVNKKDAATFLAGFYVDAIPAYQSGWIVLTKKDNRSILSFIDPVTFEVTADFYTTIAEDELGPNAVAVKEHWMAGGGLSNTGNILVIRNDPKGNIELDGTNLSPIYQTNNFFLGNTPPVNFQPRGEYYMWDFSMMLDNNGQVYTRKHVNNAFSQSGVYPNKPMFIPGDARFEKGWSGTYLSGQTILYDKIHGKLYLGSDRGLVLPVNYMPGPPLPPGITPINAMDKELVYVGNLQLGRFTGAYYLIFFNGTSHFIQKITLIDQYYSAAALFQKETQIETGNTNAASVFCQLPRIDNYLFYSGGTDNKQLYLFEQGPARSTSYYQFDSPIKNIAANQNTVMGVHTHDQLLVALENGTVYIISIHPDKITNPDGRLIKAIELNEGLPVNSIFKIGFGYTQM